MNNYSIPKFSWGGGLLDCTIYYEEVDVAKPTQTAATFSYCVL